MSVAEPPPGRSVRDPGTGHVWVTSDRAAYNLGVTWALVRLWIYRNREDIERRKAGNRTWYRLDQLTVIEMTSNERMTRASSKRVDA